jgi:hypothetical protein
VEGKNMSKIISTFKQLVFFIAYIIPLYFFSCISFPITDFFRGKENDIWVALLLAMSFACLWSVLYVHIAKGIIKTDIKILLKTNKLLYLAFAVVVIIFTMLTWFNELPIPNPIEVINTTPLLGLFAFLGWIVLTGMIVACLGLFFIVSYVAIKLVDNHPKIVTMLALLFLILWLLSLKLW